MKIRLLLPALLALAACSARPPAPVQAGTGTQAGCDNGACITEAGKTRQVQRQLESGAVATPAAVAFDCDGDDRPFTAVFYNDLEPEAAVLTWGDDTAIVFPALAASGARYAGNGVEFWEHQGEARVDFRGQPLVCRPNP
jgi:uncharacterized protein